MRRFTVAGVCGAVLGGLIVFLAVAASAEVYKWVDEQGRVHFGDRPPDKSRASRVVTQINTYEGPPLIWRYTPPPGVSTRGRIIMYGTQRCGVCRLARSYLAKRGVKYSDLDIEVSEQARQEYERLQGRGVPLFVIGDTRMNGFSEAELDALLMAQGW